MTSRSDDDALTILHLGLGAFHRAHQAAYLQALIELGDERWTIVAGNLRDDMAETIGALQRQSQSYTLETVAPDGLHRYQQIRSIRKIVTFSDDLSGLRTVAVRPATRIVSFTVTEAGYYLDARGRLEISHPDLAADLERVRERRAGHTLYGSLATLLRARRDAGVGAVTLLCCDNLRHNGDRSRSGLLQFIEMSGDDALRTWVDACTTSPNSMVDRITPRTSPALRARVLQAIGVDDAAAVTAESFTQWVIEDRFADGRPAWERVGVQLVDDVQPYEEAKIRILNATHSCIAWAGTLVGHEFIHEGMHDADIRQLAYDYATDDAIPALQPSPIDLARYRDVVLERFGNPAICDTNQRVAMDAFSKIPGFIAPTLSERLAGGHSIAAVAMLPALFLAVLQRWHAGRLPYAYQDQSMDVSAAHAICEAELPVAAFACDPVLWGPLAGDPRLIEALRAAYLRVQTFLRARVA